MLNNAPRMLEEAGVGEEMGACGQVSNLAPG